MQLQRFCNKPLSSISQADLRAYYRTHRNPDWVFPALGQNMGKYAATAKKPVSDNGVQGALRRTVKKLGIKKHVHPPCVPSFVCHASD
jgi:hypothetical protein